jgi:hypothetical protein
MMPINPQNVVKNNKMALKVEKSILNPSSETTLKLILTSIVKINKQNPIKLKIGINLYDLIVFHLLWFNSANVLVFTTRPGLSSSYLRMGRVLSELLS